MNGEASTVPSEIPLTRGMVAIVDDEDYERLAVFRWHFSTGYARRSYRISGGIKHVFMHKEVLNVSDSETLVDHINGDKLDNRRGNLRPATLTENNRNRRIGRNNVSGYVGVSWDSSRSKWKACIKHEGHLKHLGNFDVKEDAARAYNAAAVRLRGKFARPNTIKGETSAKC